MEPIRTSNISIQQKSQFPLGTLVIQLNEFKVSQVGVVYEQFKEGDINYIAVIFENGTDLGVIAEYEAENLFLGIGQSELRYQFLSPEKLMEDFKNGHFSLAFERELSSDFSFMVNRKASISSCWQGVVF